VRAIRSFSHHCGPGLRPGPGPASGPGFFARALMLLVGLYRRWISPFTPPSCRFTPTCSGYALEALRTHGFLKGSALSAWRILRCNPFVKGGYDPVPPASRSGRARSGDKARTETKRQEKPPAFRPIRTPARLRRGPASFPPPL
jgi:putative membrane protein insertion efficiency factor